MELTHRFTVPTGVEETWAHFQDIASVAECFPGASVTSVDGESFAGSVKVKLGPIALVYNGSGTFVEKDDAAHRFVVDAKGKDKRGNGTAGAKVTLTMAPAAGDATDVQVLTDLAVTGKPAQFGRGVMQDVSDKLLGQFVACLEKRLSAESSPQEAAEASAEGGVPADVPPPVDGALNGAAPQEGVDGQDGEDVAGGHTSAAPSPTPVSPRTAPRPLRPAEADADDALDLGAAVLPVLLKGYWKQLVAVGAAVAVVVWLAKRH